MSSTIENTLVNLCQNTNNASSVSFTQPLIVILDVSPTTIFKILMHKARKSHVFPTQPLFDARQGSCQNFWMKLNPQKLEGWDYSMVKIASS